jgi:hypothetical protein
MKITEGQLRRLIRQEVTRLIEGAGALTPGAPIDTPELFGKLKFGDRITVDGEPASVEKYEEPTLHYKLERAAVAEELDVNYALSQDQDLDDGPVVQVVWNGPRITEPGDVYPRWLD